MTVVGIVGNAPGHHSDLKTYKEEVDFWIGADRGAWVLATCDLPITYAIGDFDSTTKEEKLLIDKHAQCVHVYPSEKDETDLELALNKAYELEPDTIYLFGVSGGRKDHEFINVQLLYAILSKGIRGIIIDIANYLELTFPGKYTVLHDINYPIISFVPFSKEVKGITLTHFYYPLTNANISWGSTLCISNKLIRNSGTFSYKEGILLLVKSRD
ncbi:thiamine diphosphokinase [Virgibacillus sp. Bac330]|uniref:thiamine diphosphokinase n=1 Tax=Virgibacillus sp. Bac330 TaxID=2419841 RepID=UPI000EF51442|nr:thiamine diphosphokinase [Virgibacillus sp. Bac330]